MRRGCMWGWRLLCVGLLGLAMLDVQPVQAAVARPRHAKNRLHMQRPATTAAVVGTAAPSQLPSNVPRAAAPAAAKLAGKQDYGLDATVQKTKDLRQNSDLNKKPVLSTEALDTTQMESLVNDKLEEEIKNTSALLQFESKCDETAPVRYRLADLYWEKSKRAFFQANDNAATAAQRAFYTTEQKTMQGNALSLYQKILDECPGFSDTAKVLFYYGKSLMELERDKEAAVLFRRIIDEFPQSEWVPQAWFMVGEYYFNTANDVMSALKAYNKAAAAPRSPIYGFVLYKQAWCYINVAEWGLAQQRLEEMIKVSQDNTRVLDERVRALLHKEALKDYVRVYANNGDAPQALSKFRAIAEERDLPGMLENLGNWYISQGAHLNVITTYRTLIRTYPNSTRLVIFQGRIVDSVSRLGDLSRTIAEVKLLKQLYLALQQRQAAANANAAPDDSNRAAKDFREAQDLGENILRRLAVAYHKEAKKLHGVMQKREYEVALQLYRDYLEMFPKPKPDSEINYAFFMRFYYAEVLFKLEHFLESAQNYEALIDSDPHPKDAKLAEIVVAAAEEAIRAYDELVSDLDRKDPPEIGGAQPKPIPEIKQSFIKACERYIPYASKDDDKVIEVRYKMARVYYIYNHFDAAAPAFNDIVENHPQSSVACYAANLVLDIYNGQKKYYDLKRAAHQYIENKKLACGSDDRQRFTKIEEQSAFHLIKDSLEDKKKYIAAGNAYLQFYREHPHSEFADAAIYNAALNYDLGNRLDKANAVRRFLVEGLPTSKLVPETLYGIALSYERVVDFDNAAKYLDLFARRYPHDKRSKDAIYNAALYWATLYNFDLAHAERQNFMKLYAKDHDVPKVAFANCDAYGVEAQLLTEKHHTTHATKMWEEAYACYKNYNSKYSRDSVDASCHAEARQASILALLGDTKRSEQARLLLLRKWPNYSRSGVKKLPRCVEDVAEARFVNLEKPFKEYSALKISALDPTPQGKRNFNMSRKRKIGLRDSLVAQYRDVAKLGVAAWSLAALYHIGAAYVESVEALLGAPIPDRIPGYKLSPDDKQMLRQQLREMVTPIENQAVEAFQICVAKANELGRYNKWSVRSLDALQKLRPNAYPLIEESYARVTVPTVVHLPRNEVVIQEGDSFKTLQLRWQSPIPAAPPAPPPGAAKPAAATPPAVSPAALPAALKDEPLPADTSVPDKAAAATDNAATEPDASDKPDDAPEAPAADPENLALPAPAKAAPAAPNTTPERHEAQP